MIIEMVQRSQVTISDGRHKGIVAERLYTMLWEKIDEIYTGEIHVFEKHTRLNILLHWITARSFSILYNRHNQWRDRDNN